MVELFFTSMSGVPNYLKDKMRKVEQRYEGLQADSAETKNILKKLSKVRDINMRQWVRNYPGH